MKRLYTLIAICASCAPTVILASPSENLSNFSEGALELVRGIRNSDKDALADAGALLEAADVEELGEFIVEESAPQVLGDPLILFTSDFCDKYRKNNFTLVPLNPLEGLRAIPGIVSTITRSISPGASVVFTLEGADDMAMTAVMAEPAALEFTLITPKGETPLPLSADGFIAGAEWSLDQAGEDFSVRVTNPSDGPVTFVLGFE